jgi:tetratricopeptide (TPR) repeat protein
MSERRANPIKLKWYRGGFGVVCESLEAKLERDRMNGFRMSKEERDYVECRLGINLYKCGRYFDAIGMLELATKGGHTGTAKSAERIKARNALIAANDGKVLKDKSKEVEAEALQAEIDQGPIIHRDFKVHRAAARCCIELFKLTHAHYHLEAAHKHYENAIQTMPAGLVALFTLPPMLFEFGKMCEMYGAFKAALELYSKIITGFPNYRGYFDAMYRLCLCGRHIAEVTKNEKESDDLLNKSLDMLQFLLEAVPPSIEEAHIILLYSHTLELSSDPAMRFRAAGAFQGLHDYYKVG